MRPGAGETIDEQLVAAIAAAWRKAGTAAALTGAGISVESGIPDFRSRRGIWARYPVETYGLLSSFLKDPARSWAFFRAVRASARDAVPNRGHRALARLEAAGRLAGIVTQNVDGLHQAAGSRCVVEIHGSDRQLDCPGCGHVMPTPRGTFSGEGVPTCPACGGPMKPRVVLFEEPILAWEEAVALVEAAALLLVVGTSVQVEPAASLPYRALARGGVVVECNHERTPLTRDATYVLRAGAGEALDALARAVLRD